MADDTPIGDHSELADHVGPSRRTFIKRVAVGAAFAAPVVSSFSMSGVNAAFAQSNGSGNQPPP